MGPRARSLLGKAVTESENNDRNTNRILYSAGTCFRELSGIIGKYRLSVMYATTEWAWDKSPDEILSVESEEFCITR
jgi:hypothetical protein